MTLKIKKIKFKEIKENLLFIIEGNRKIAIN